MAEMIPSAVRKQIVAATDISEVIQRHIELKKAGNELVGRSPFTNEKTPSFCVVPHKRFWHCFSSGKSGDVVTFLVEVAGTPYREAIKQLAQEVGIDVSQYFAQRPKTPQQRQQEGEARQLTASLNEASKFFRRALLQPNAREVRDICKLRRIGTQQVLDFGIGWAPPRYSLPASANKALEAGLLISSDDGRTYPRFRDRLMFPIRDERGEIVSFGGRVLGEGRPKYMNGPETSAFKKGAVLYGLHESLQAHGRYGKLDSLVLAEGYMDVITLMRAGEPAAGMMSASASDQQIVLAQRHAKAVYLCSDGDRAGIDGLMRSIEKALPLVGQRTEWFVISLSDGADPDSFINAYGAERFRAIKAAAPTLTTYLIDRISDMPGGLDAASPESKISHLKEHAKILARITDRPMLEVAAYTLAKRFGLSKTGLLGMIDQAAGQGPEIAVADSGEAKGATAPTQTSVDAKSILDMIRLSFNDDDLTVEGPEVVESEPRSRRNSARAQSTVLSRSPALRAAQILLHHPVAVEPWDEAFLFGDDIRGVPGGDILSTLASLRSRNPDAVAGDLLSEIPEGTGDHWLNYILPEPPELPDELAARVLSEMISLTKAELRSRMIEEILGKAGGQALSEIQLKRINQLITGGRTEISVEDGTNQRSDGLTSDPNESRNISM